MITTGANPQAAIAMSNIKNNFGKSVTKGLMSAANKVILPAGGRMEKAVQQGYHNAIRSMVNNQARQEQK